MTSAEIISTEPATGAELWRGEIGDVGEAVARAWAGWRPWALRPLQERVAVLRAFADEVRRQEAPFAELIARETGKPLWEARTEVAAVIGKVEISIRAHEERTGSRALGASPQGEAFVRHKPHGVLAVLGPYNFPAHLPNGHIVPALISGNAVVFKPSEKTPATGAFLVRCYHQAGVPEQVVQLLLGGPAEGQALVGHPGTDGVLFTGSERAGIAINRALAGEPGKIVALEMGGNNPLVLWDTARVEDAAGLVVQSAFTTAGQRCTAARRLIVGAELYDAAVEQIGALIHRTIVGAPFDEPQPFMGPVIDNAAAEGLLAGYEALLAAGGKALVPLTRPDPALPFLTPGLVDITALVPRPDGELFGPLLQVIRVGSFDEAIAVANDTRFGLSASLIGGTREHYDAFWSSVRAGIVNWNRPTNGASSAAPFGGVGASGNHRPAAYYAADYCAYPVASTEMENPEAALGPGFSAR
jgi:succinylglutamic semialdehyde dehydrogenase